MRNRRRNWAIRLLHFRSLIEIRCFEGFANRPSPGGDAIIGRVAQKGIGAITGRLVCHPEGYGFVIPEDSSLGQDVFIPPKKMGSAVDGDTVRVRVSPSRRGRKRDGKSLEGEVLEVVSRARQTLVGKLIRYRKETCVAPLDPRYHYTVTIQDDKADEIPDGQIVVVAILAQPSRHQPPIGAIEEVFGDPNDPDIQYRIVCHNHGIPMEFPPEALQEAQAACEPDAAEVHDRTDFRNLLTVTIDGETARDFDDAVSIEPLQNGSFRLWVHIADVSHYAHSGSRLDAEAYRRGTSVYFPDRAIHMLPTRLAQEICSLKPGVDRLTVTVAMDIDRQGNVVHSEYHRSVINSNERMTYTAVNEILVNPDSPHRRRCGYLVPSFEWMLELCEILRSRRARRGAIDFDLPEAEIEYDVNGQILDIVRSERNVAHRIIEEFMLIANETVAEYLEDQRLGVLYRIHERPDPVKVEEFLDIASKFGHALERDREGHYPSRSFQKLTERLNGKPEAKFLSYLMLRSFKLARYSSTNEGHFGLAARSYAHFTSPIRRYPDLTIHRTLKFALNGASSPEAEELFSRLPEIADQSSQRERKAVDAERAIMRWLMAKFMAERLGEEYDGFVIGVERNGFYVELLDHFVEGFVPVETIWDDFYTFNQRHHCLIGENSGKVYRIGDQVRVRVDKVNPERHFIEFSPLITSRPSERRRKR